MLYFLFRLSTFEFRNVTSHQVELRKTTTSKLRCNIDWFIKYQANKFNPIPETKHITIDY